MKLTGTSTLVALGLGLVAACGGSGDETTTAAPTPPAEADAGPVETTEATPAAAPAAAELSPEFAGLPEPYASADLARGKRVYLQCQTCHTLEEGGPVVLGPNLYGLFGRQAGQAPGFQYSDALVNAGFDWTPEQLDQWLQRPSEFLPGNRMSFAGVTRPDDRVAVIAYIMSQTGYEAAE